MNRQRTFQTIQQSIRQRMHRSVQRVGLFALVFSLTVSVAAAQGFLLDVPLPITGPSSQAVIRALDGTVREIDGLRKDVLAKAAATSDASGNNEPDVDSDVKSLESAPRPTIVLRFRVGPNQEAFGRGSTFGACYELARELIDEKLNGIRTVAYFPQTVKGHVLLPALACDERIIAEEAEIGEAAADEQDISPTQRNAYREIARHRAVVPEALVDKILDPRAVLLQVETEKGTRLLDPDGVEELRKTETFAEEPVVLIPAGQPGLFTADSARKINLVDRLADDRVALARSLGYRPDDLRYAPIPRQLGSAVRINLNGPINNDNTAATIRAIRSAIDPNPAGLYASPNPSHQPRQAASSKVDFICLCINSPGGNVEASLNLASFIAQEIDSAKVRTVAYVPYQARSDAALIAVACDEIVLGPAAVLGGDGAAVFSEQRIKDARRTIREFLSKEALRSWSLPVALVDPSMTVFKATRQGRPALVDYFCEEEWEQQPDARLWIKGDEVKPEGRLLEVIGSKGPQYLVDRSARDFNEFKMLYRLEDDPLLVEPGWADKLIRALSSPGASATILLIVFFAVMIELNSPGIGIGTFVAVMGIVLFFWLHFLGGTAGWLEVVLFLAGVLFVLTEIFVLPGFGVFGLGGALAIIASLVLASQTFIIPQNSYQYAQFQNSLLILAVSGIGVLLLGGAVSKSIHRFTKPKDTELIRETERLANYDALLGQTGRTLTPLVPSGRALFGDRPVDVVSEGTLIEKGRTVEVIDVVGYRVVVRQSQREA